MSEFFDYVRGVSETLPKGYTQQGMAVYRHHVYLGVSQLLAQAHPELRAVLSDDDWTLLMKDFIAKSQWVSHFYADLNENFKLYLSEEVNQPPCL